MKFSANSIPLTSLEEMAIVDNRFVGSLLKQAKNPEKIYTGADAIADNLYRRLSAGNQYFLSEKQCLFSHANCTASR